MQFMKINLISIKARANQLYQTWLELELWRWWFPQWLFLYAILPGGGGMKSPLSASPAPASFGLTIVKLSFWPRCIVSSVHLSPLPSCSPSSALLQFYFWHRLADADVSSVPNFVATAKLHASCCSIPKPPLPRLPVPFITASAYCCQLCCSLRCIHLWFYYFL